MNTDEAIDGNDSGRPGEIGRDRRRSEKKKMKGEETKKKNSRLARSDGDINERYRIESSRDAKAWKGKEGVLVATRSKTFACRSRFCVLLSGARLEVARRSRPLTSQADSLAEVATDDANANTPRDDVCFARSASSPPNCSPFRSLSRST